MNFFHIPGISKYEVHLIPKLPRAQGKVEGFSESLENIHISETFSGRRCYLFGATQQRMSVGASPIRAFFKEQP
jgi:hypothetical protein